MTNAFLLHKNALVTSAHPQCAAMSGGLPSVAGGGRCAPAAFR